MTQISPNELLKVLAKLGFKGRQGGNHTILFYVLDGKKTRIRTVVDRHGRDFGDGRMSSIAREIGLERAELDRAIDGQMTEAEFVKIVKARGKT